MNGEDIRRRYNVLRTQRKTIEQTYEDIERYIAPGRGEFYRPMHSEHEQTHEQDHFDSTAVDAATSLKSYIHGMLVSPVNRWYDLRFYDERYNEDQAAIDWLQEVQELTFGEITESNFQIASAEFLYDMITFGDGFAAEEANDPMVNPEWEGVKFQTLGVRESFFELDSDGNLERFYRRIQWTPLEVYTKFGDDTPEDIQEQMDDAQAVDTKHEIIWCVYKRDINSPRTQLIAPRLRPYGMKYIRHSDAKMLGEEGGYYEMPVFTAPWASTSGSKFGKSPAHDAMADVIQLNTFCEAKREQAGMALAPPMMTTQRNIIGDLNLKKRGLTMVSDPGKLVEMVTQARFDTGEREIADLRDSVRRIFLLDELQIKDSPAMTATEVQYRYDKMVRFMSQTLASIQYKFLRPVVDRTLRIMYRSNRLPAPPSSEIAGADINVSYKGPMARAQKMSEVENVRVWLGDVMSLAKIQLEGQGMPVLDNVDFDKIVRDMALETGVDAEFLLPMDDVTKSREERAQIAEQQRQIAETQAAGQSMEAVGKGAAALEGDSPAQLKAVQ